MAKGNQRAILALRHAQDEDPYGRTSPDVLMLSLSKHEDRSISAYGSRRP
jgi:hypothetical protein